MLKRLFLTFIIILCGTNLFAAFASEWTKFSSSKGMTWNTDNLHCPFSFIISDIDNESCILNGRVTDQYPCNLDGEAWYANGIIYFQLNGETSGRTDIAINGKISLVNEYFGTLTGYVIITESDGNTRKIELQVKVTNKEKAKRTEMMKEVIPWRGDTIIDFIQAIAKERLKKKEGQTDYPSDNYRYNYYTVNAATSHIKKYKNKNGLHIFSMENGENFEFSPDFGRFFIRGPQKKYGVDKKRGDIVWYFKSENSGNPIYIVLFGSTRQNGMSTHGFYLALYSGFLYIPKLDKIYPIWDSDATKIVKFVCKSGKISEATIPLKGGQLPFEFNDFFIDDK